jgi:GxxExxY protein
MDIEEVGRNIVDGAVKVHMALGPGLLESAYQACLAYELTKRGLIVACEVPVPLIYNGHTVETGYRIDMLVENSVIIENKVAEKLLPLHEAQLITYLKLRGCWLGYLLNWNTIFMKNGIRRIVYGANPNNV